MKLVVAAVLFLFVALVNSLEDNNLQHISLNRVLRGANKKGQQ